MTTDERPSEPSLTGHTAPGKRPESSQMTTPHRSIPSQSSAVAGATSQPRRRHPITLLWSVPGWRPLFRHATADLQRAGGNVLLGVDWTTATLWWRVHDPLGHDAQRVLVRAAATALKTCQACGAGRCWREPTTRLPRSIIGTVAGPVRLRLCAGCRMQLQDPARFLTGLEAADVVAAAKDGA